jgi:hypothetical protein
MRTILALEDAVCATSGDAETSPTVEDYLHNLLRVDGYYAEYKPLHAPCPCAVLQQRDTRAYRRFYLTARLWRILDAAARGYDLVPGPDWLQTFADDFRRERQIDQPDTMAEWLRCNDLTAAEVVVLLQSWYIFNMLVNKYHLDAVGVTPSDYTVWWLRDALWLSGLYQDARSLLHLPPDQLVQAITVPDSDATALRRDFTDGAQSVQGELTALLQMAVQSQEVLEV